MNKKFWTSYLLYDLRWILAAIPGAILMDFTLKYISNLYIAMLTTQAILGLGVFWIDRKILK